MCQPAEGCKTREDEEKLDNRIFKSVKILEDICTTVQSSQKEIKADLSHQVAELKRKMDKILNNNVSYSHKEHYSRDINRALKILTTFSAQ